jgi:hypothetical protein
MRGDEGEVGEMRDEMEMEEVGCVEWLAGVGLPWTMLVQYVRWDKQYACRDVLRHKHTSELPLSHLSLSKINTTLLAWYLPCEQHT